MFDSLTKGFQNLFRRFTGDTKLTEENIQEALREVRLALLGADVSLQVARDFLARVRTQAVGQMVVEGVNPGQMLVKILSDELTALMGTEAAPLLRSDSPPTVILMAGLQGAGKTTTCAKLALRLKKEHRKVLLVAADLQRPAAVEQLKVLGADLDIAVHAEGGKRPPEVCAAALERARREGFDTVILDTAGRLHVDDELMREVVEIAQRTKPTEVLLVCDAMTGQDAVNSAKAFDLRLALTGVILTKLDGDARGGAAMSIRAVTGKPIKFVGTGEKADRLDVFHPGRMAERILGMGDVVSLVERAQEVIDDREAKEQAEKMFLGSFTLQDFLGMIEKVRSMGPLKDIMAMLPGMSSQMEGMNVDEKEFDRSRAMIQSMTSQERTHPEIINHSRRQRIASGSGTTGEQVDGLLRNFRNLRKQMQSMRKMGMLSGLLDPSKGLRKEKQRELERMQALGVNPLDTHQVKAFRAHLQREDRAKARKNKRRKR
ncbi:MAG: signal recognition particle protein [Planctomycetes bacterium]|nr:signal recognition particle protein [Planctomycetota bacterium]